MLFAWLKKILIKIFKYCFLTQFEKCYIFVKHKKCLNRRQMFFFQKFYPPENFRNLCLQKFDSYIFANMIDVLLDCNWNVVLGCGGSKDIWPDGQQAHREESGEEDWESQGKNTNYRYPLLVILSRIVFASLLLLSRKRLRQSRVIFSDFSTGNCSSNILGTQACLPYGIRMRFQFHL